MMNNDLDVDLVRTFDQMQTLDKEDLVGQMLRLVGGNGLTSEAAAFYLEMNAWNVQVRCTKKNRPCTFASFSSAGLHVCLLLK